MTPLLREIFTEMFVADTATAVDYYRTLFDLSVHHQDGSFTELHGHGLRFNICGLDELPEHLASRSAEANRQVGSRVELCFVVSDIQEVFRRAVAMEAVVAEPIMERSWGRTDFRLVGPEGAYLRITTPQPTERTYGSEGQGVNDDAVSSGSDPGFQVLHRLRILGSAQPDRLAEATGLSQETVGPLLDGLRRESLAQRREGRVTGWSLTPAGREEHAGSLAAGAPSIESGAALDAGYRRFLPLDREFKAICTAWQLRDAGTLMANDHTDRVYDGRVLARLRRLHSELQPLLAEITRSLTRFGAYSGRFSTAFRRVVEGETDALTRPLTGSYHDVWMEFHEDLLLTLGRERGSETQLKPIT